MKTFLQEKDIPRVIGLGSLILCGITCMIGSGWLFAAYYTAKVAGTAAIYAWLLGGVAVLFIALSISQVSNVLPLTGGLARYLDYTHGSLTGFLMSWCNWLGIITVIPIEAVASIQYLSSLNISWIQNWFDLNTNLLTPSGLVAGAVLILVYFLLNYWGVKLFLRITNILTIFKIIVPLATIAVLFYCSYHPENFSAAVSDNNTGTWASVLTAITTCGIIMSFNGFQTPASLAGEAKNPRINLPLAIIIAIIAVLGIYILLQITFIAAVDPNQLQAGWQAINFKSPFAELAIALNLNFLLLCLYVDAVISPSTTGITYMAAAARTTYAMSVQNHIASIFQVLNPRYHTPRIALLFNFVISLVFLIFFRSWEHLVAIVSVTFVISYIAGPIAASSLSKLLPEHKFLNAKFMRLVNLCGFIIISLLFYCSRWPLTGQITILIVLGLLVYAYYQFHQHGRLDIKHIKSALWLVFYFPVLALISYLGSEEFGGIGLLNSLLSYSTVMQTATLFHWWAVKSAWHTPSLSTITPNK